MSSPLAASAVSAPSTITIQKVSLEFASLGTNIPEGMYLTPSQQNIMLWHGVLFIHQGYYAGAVLRFRLLFPNDYPLKAPSVIFETDVFHPLIATKDGKMSLASRFRPWIPDEHHVFDVLHWMKAAFKKDVLERLEESDCVHPEAFRYKTTPASFAALAKQSTDLSLRDSVIYSSDESPSMRVSTSRDRASARANTKDGIQFSLLDDLTLANLRSQLGLTDWSKVVE